MAKPPLRQKKPAIASAESDGGGPKTARQSSTLGDIFASDTVAPPKEELIVELDEASLEDDDAEPDRAERESIEPDPRQVPDSLVPVRMSELVDSQELGSSPGGRAPGWGQRLRSVGTPVGAFVAGALVVLLARPMTAPEPRAAAACPEPLSAATKPQPAREAAHAARQSPAQATAEPSVSGDLAVDAMAAPAVSASADAEPPPKKRRIKVRRKKPQPEYKPPTAAFPD